MVEESQIIGRQEINNGYYEHRIYCDYKTNNKMFDMIKNKLFIGIISLVTVSAPGGFILSQKISAEPQMIVYKSPTCGCCSKWIKHMKKNGFQIKAVDVLEMNIVKEKYGVTRKLASCHTAVIDGYVIEGHVPAIDVKRLLSEKPDVLGLSVPGMPVGSPGMEMGDRVDRYTVIAIGKDGDTEVFNQY